MRAIYMPLIRRAVTEYVETWNSHTIRKQRNRPNSIGGRPIFLYNHANIERFRCAIDQELLQQAISEFNGYGYGKHCINSYFHYYYTIQTNHNH